LLCPKRRISRGGSVRLLSAYQGHLMRFAQRRPRGLLQARRESRFSKNSQTSLTPRSAANGGFFFRLHRANSQDVLGQIEPHRGNLHGGRSFSCVLLRSACSCVALDISRRILAHRCRWAGAVRWPFDQAALGSNPWLRIARPRQVLRKLRLASLLQA
jgi:hypothetical protein